MDGLSIVAIVIGIIAVMLGGYWIYRIAKEIDRLNCN